MIETYKDKKLNTIDVNYEVDIDAIERNRISPQRKKPAPVPSEIVATVALKMASRVWHGTNKMALSSKEVSTP